MDKRLDEIEQRNRLVRLVDWLYDDSGDDEMAIEQVEAELREAGIDMDAVQVRMREMISRLSRASSEGGVRWKKQKTPADLQS